MSFSCTDRLRNAKTVIEDFGVDSALFTRDKPSLPDNASPQFNLQMQFEDDVYIATSEPHGNIEATITRGDVKPHAKL